MQCGSYNPLSVLSHAPEKEAQVETQIWPQTWPPWKTTLLTCCCRAVCVCGILCTYMTECSAVMFVDVSEGTCSVTSSGNEFHAWQASHVVFYPCQFNTDAVSHPVSVWNIARARDFSHPREAASWMSCCGGTQIICSPSVTTSSLSMLVSLNDWMSTFERKLKLTWKLAQLPTCTAQTSRNSSPLMQSFNEELVVTDGKQVICVSPQQDIHSLAVSLRNVARPPNILCTNWMWYCVVFC